MNESEFNREIGAKLTAMRKAKKKSRRDIAKHLDVSVDYIGKMERGEYPITSFRLTQWVLFLGGEMQIGGEITVPNTLALTKKAPDG